jgi:molybdopterin converting factor small subunit
MAPLGRRRGTRTIVALPLESETVVDTLAALVRSDARYAHLFDAATQTLPEHVEIVLNDRVLDLQGGLSAVLHDGDTLTFLPAHAGG